ncbi:MAG: ferredoxin [Oligoflexales bacterium]
MESRSYPSDRAAAKNNVTNYNRHILLCAGPKCCDSEKGEGLWKFLKSRLKELSNSSVQCSLVYRTKVHCLRICADGPIAVVYPEGTWYRFLDEQKLEAIIQSHLIGGRPVEELQFAKNDNFK